MKNDVKIYFFLLLFVVLQIFLLSRISVFPDIIVILVVYAGIFYDMKNLLLVAFTAGFLRGVFSPETMSADIAVFPMIGVFSYSVGKLFNRNNPIGGVIISFITVILLLVIHTFILNAVNHNSMPVSFIFFENWRTVLVSAAAYPLVYLFLNIFLKRKKNSSDTKRIFY